MQEKLLILGIDTATRFIIAEARKKGIYTILTDYNPIEKAPLKKMADEAWMLNVGAIDELEVKCRESGVTAVIAGNHEFCLDSAKKLAERLGLPFYADDVCWNAARNKRRFKELCRESGLAAAKDYTIDGPIRYPVCVKPSDSSAQRGISVVYREEDLQAAYEKALSFSVNKQIIIEQYLTGQEITIFGYADNGTYHLFNVAETLSVNCTGKLCLSMIAHSPGAAAEMLRKNASKLWTLLRKMNHRNGLFILQGFVEEDGLFYLMESGVRFDGGVMCDLARQVYGIDPVSWMIDLARGLKPQTDWSGTDITSPGKYYGEYGIYCRPGRIARMEGEQKTSSTEGLDFILKRFAVGDTVGDVGNMTQCAYYVHILADTPEDFIRKLKMVNSELCIYGEDGSSLLIYVTDYDRILHSLTR